VVLISCFSFGYLPLIVVVDPNCILLMIEHSLHLDFLLNIILSTQYIEMKHKVIVILLQILSLLFIHFVSHGIRKI